MDSMHFRTGRDPHTYTFGRWRNWSLRSDSQGNTFSQMTAYVYPHVFFSTLKLLFFCMDVGITLASGLCTGYQSPESSFPGHTMLFFLTQVLRPSKGTIRCRGQLQSPSYAYTAATGNLGENVFSVPTALHSARRQKSLPSLLLILLSFSRLLQTKARNVCCLQITSTFSPATKVLFIP